MELTWQVEIIIFGILEKETQLLAENVSFEVEIPTETDGIGRDLSPFI